MMCITLIIKCLMTGRALESRPTSAVDAQKAISRNSRVQLASLWRSEPENGPRELLPGLDATANFCDFPAGPQTSAHGARSGQSLASVG